MELNSSELSTIKRALTAYFISMTSFSFIESKSCNCLFSLDRDVLDMDIINICTLLEIID